MSPTIIAAALEILQLAIKEEPAIRAGLTSLLQKTNPTPEEWAVLRASILAKSYEDYVK